MVNQQRLRLHISLLAVLLPIVLAPQNAAAVSPLFSRGYSVIPEPQQVVFKGGDFEFGNGWRLEVGPGVAADDVAIDSLKDGLLDRYGIRPENAGSGRSIVLSIQPGAVPIGHSTDKNHGAIEQQAYKLELASAGIRITANAPAGLFYGVETLVQLVKPAEGKLWLPAAQITDWPDLEQRNLYWDDNHHLDHIDVLKKALRQAAFYKINGFVIKLNGHFEYASAPALVEPYALSPGQLQNLTNYGLRYHVQLIPYLDAPAHISFILKHPEYAALREFPDSNYELCTTNPDSYKLLDGMYQDLLDANRGVKYFVLSTDEPYYVGLADSSQCHSARLAKQLGSVGKVLAAFLDKAAGYLHDRGRTVIFWGEDPLVPGDIPSLPDYLVNGEIYGPAFDRAFKARGIRQMVFTSLEGAEPLFPNYYALPLSRRYNPVPIDTRLKSMFRLISYDSSRQNSDLMGVFIAGWGDEGLHPETFWLGYAAGPAWGWHPGSPTPAEVESSFFKSFYGSGATDMARLYQLMATQAEFWASSWDREPSSVRKPIFGNSYGIFKVRQPAHDQTLPLPAVPEGEYLRLPYNWGMENARRVHMAGESMPEVDELIDLLHTNLRSVQFQRYNLQVFLSIARLYRQNLEMLSEIGKIDAALQTAQSAAAHAQSGPAVKALDRALDFAQQIKTERNRALQNAIGIWLESWDPRVSQANGRRYLNAIDDVKDHLPGRTVDMSYLVYRELILPFGHWFDQVEAERNRYAEAHHMPLRSDKLDWQDTRRVEEQVVP